jgi:hypothetical protein
VPFAGNSTHSVPDGVTDEQMLMRAGILLTSYEVGVIDASVRPADVMVIVGAGTIGPAAIPTVRLFGPSRVVAIDLAESRVEAARKFGADIVKNGSTEDPEMVIATLTDGLNADVVMEAVGTAHTFELAVKLVPRWRSRRQHRCPRSIRDAAPRRRLGQAPDHYHRPGRPPLDTAIDRAGRRRRSGRRRRDTTRAG